MARCASTADLAASAVRARAALGGRFQFLNVERDLGRPVDWQAPGASQLWRYKLQYGGYLVDLAAGSEAGWPEVAALMREWTQANPIGGAGDAWHPFVVSERLVNWMLALDLATCGTRLDANIARSLGAQCAFVADNLETDVGGNHLLKNLKALGAAGCFWSGTLADGWYQHGVTMFTSTLQQQLLADGAHYERSPMYHALVLEDALELAALIRCAGRPVPPDLASAARAMLTYLPHVTHPDGELALFNDSVFGEAPPPSALQAFGARVLDDRDSPGSMTVRQAVFCRGLDRGAPPPAAAASPRVGGGEDGGLVSLPILDGRGAALVDVGPACPDDLPAHAHADIFSFELSIDGRRVVVDSGVGEYAAGEWREYYRSTRAHNTLAVDGIDQIECWDSFRVGRRARILDRRTIAGPLAEGVTARHDGYARLRQPVWASRTFLAIAGRAWLVLDRLDGTGRHRWESFVHAAPEVTVEFTGDRSAVLRREQLLATVVWFGAASASVTSGAREPLQGWYAPEFGRRLAAPVLALSGEGAVPLECGYLVAPDLDPRRVDVVPSGRGLRIRLGDLHLEVGTEERGVTLTPGS